MEDKKIIGWKLKPECEQYNKACQDITGYDFNFIIGKNHSEDDYAISGDGSVMYSTDCYTKLKEAGVLRLWFEPVYEAVWKPQIGEWVTVIEQDHPYSKGEVFKVARVFNSENYVRHSDSILGIRVEKVRKATSEEIQKASEQVFQMADDFQLTVRDKKVYHKDEEITAYVLEMGKWIESFPTKFSKWAVTIDDITFRKTGCQDKRSSWECSWGPIYKLIK